MACIGLTIADEGHRLKNANIKTSQSAAMYDYICFSAVPASLFPGKAQLIIRFVSFNTTQPI